MTIINQKIPGELKEVKDKFKDGELVKGEPIKPEAPEPSLEIKPIKKTKSSNIEDDYKVLLTPTEKTDLTDAGATVLHKHDHGGLDGLADDDHTQYLKELSEDTTPQLGGDLDLNSKNIDFPSVANVSDCKDEDDLASDSATMLATQQSIKKYVDDTAVTDHGALTGLTDNDHPQYGLQRKSLTAGMAITINTAISMLDNGEVIESVGDTTAPNTVYTRFIGFADAAINKDAAGVIRTGGIMAGFSGLTPGSIYYLKNNASWAGSETQTQETKDATKDNSTYTQTYTPTKPFLISVIFWLENLIGTGADITLTIKEGNTTLGSKLIPVPDEAAQEYVWTFTNPVLTTPGGTIQLEMIIPDNMKWHYNTAGGYAGGAFYQTGVPETPFGDVYFKLTEADSDGQIDDSAGDNSQVVGKALSATELLILNGV